MRRRLESEPSGTPCHSILAPVLSKERILMHRHPNFIPPLLARPDVSDFRGHEFPGAQLQIILCIAMFVRHASLVNLACCIPASVSVIPIAPVLLRNDARLRLSSYMPYTTHAHNSCARCTVL